MANEPPYAWNFQNKIERYREPHATHLCFCSFHVRYSGSRATKYRLDYPGRHVSKLFLLWGDCH